MKKIQSFEVDHTKFGVGMYISRVDRDIVTYDIRMVKPNGGIYLCAPSIHTIEHIFATYARNSKWSDDIIYVGPMGCQTGFYLVVRDNINHEDAIKLVYDAMCFIRDYKGEIPGNSEVECGNYKMHDIENAKKDVLNIIKVLKTYTTKMLNYVINK